MPADGPVFHWFLPTGADDTVLGAGVHGAGIGANGSARGRGRGGRPRSTTSQLARAADSLGFAGVLTPTGAHCEDAWLTTAALIAETRRLRFLVAFGPGLVSPILEAQMAATFQRLSSRRLLLNVVIGSSSAEQRGYGDMLDHDELYDRAREFLDVIKCAWQGTDVDHVGTHYTVENGRLREPPDPIRRVYIGGSSDAAMRVAAQHADVYLTWGEPSALVAEKVAKVRELATERGRRIRFGIRLHVISRDTTRAAWDDANRLIASVDDATIRYRQAELRRLESVGQRRMLALHNGDRDNLVVAPNLWAGIGLVRGGAGTALVERHDEVAERIEEYRGVGVDEFIFSGYPHLEGEYAFGEGVLPLFPTGHTRRSGRERNTVAGTGRTTRNTEDT